MARHQATPTIGHLRYLKAEHVRCSNGTLAGHVLCTRDDEDLGALDGVLLDPLRRRLRYFVVESPSLLRRRYLVRADAPATVEGHDRLLRVQEDADDIMLERFDERAVPNFSDEDVITSMFAHPAA